MPEAVLEEYVLVPVFKGGKEVARAKVDKKYQAAIEGRSWLLHKKGYAVAFTRGPRTRKHPNGAPRTIYMHRLVWELHHGVILTRYETIDHIEVDPLDNRIGKLQMCGTAENSRLAHWRATGQNYLKVPEASPPRGPLNVQGSPRRESEPCDVPF